MLTQIGEITMMNLRNLGSRLGSSSVIVVGIAGVVAVLVALLAMGTGFRGALERTGDPHRAIVLRGGAAGELSSGMDVNARNVVASMEGVRNSSGERPPGREQLSSARRCAPYCARHASPRTAPRRPRAAAPASPARPD